MTVVLIGLTIAIYSPGLPGGFMFDDYPNIVDNPAVQPKDASVSSLVAAAMSSPSSELKRPIASLSFAADYLANGLNPTAMKITNLVIHIANGLLLFVLLRILLPHTLRDFHRKSYTLIAGAISLAWLTAPINLTPVLYVVQRMESLANAFVLIGLISYVALRRNSERGLLILIAQVASITVPALIGVMAKETAVLLPLYGLCIEATIFRFRLRDGSRASGLLWAYALILIPPIIFGTAWLAPGILNTQTWATRDFTLRTRLLTEPRVLIDYLQWTIFPNADDLSFYHDDFIHSTGWLSPWQTIAAVFSLCALMLIALKVRRSNALFTLGVLFFFACHTLTATVLPLELVYEHRNYFASIGAIMAASAMFIATWQRLSESSRIWRYLLIFLPAAGMIYAAGLSFATSQAWGTSLGLAEELARRGPLSPRAQYELGRAYIIDSHYDPRSRSAELAYAPLERAALLPNSSILPQQALIFFNARLHRPLKDSWWSTMNEKLVSRPATIQDESSLDALASCLRQALCDIPEERLHTAFEAAASHPRKSARLAAIYAKFAWYTERNRTLALRLEREAVASAPNEGAYGITLAWMLIQSHELIDARKQLTAIRSLNVGGRYDADIANLETKLKDPTVATPLPPETSSHP